MNLLKKNTKNLIFSSLFLFSSSSVKAETPIFDMEMAIIVQSAFNRCMLEEKVLTKEQAITMNRGGAAVTPELFNPVIKIIENAVQKELNHQKVLENIKNFLKKLKKNDNL